MAAGDFYIGDATAVGFTLSGGWDGTLKTKRFMLPVEGDAGIMLGRSQLHDPPTMATDPEKVTTGGSRCSGSFTVPLTYQYLETIIGAICGAATVKSGAAAPYTHTGTPTRALLFMALSLYWENYEGTRMQRDVVNALITQLTIKQDPEKAATATVNWYAQKSRRSTPGAFPTIPTYQIADWEQNVLTLNGSTLIHHGLTLDWAWPAQEGIYGVGNPSDPSPRMVARGGQRIFTLQAKGLQDDALEDMIEAGTILDGTNAVTWNNGLSGGDEAEFKVTMGDLFPQVAQQDKASRGTIPVDMTFITQGSAPFVFTTKNALSVDEPPAV